MERREIRSLWGERLLVGVAYDYDYYDLPRPKTINNLTNNYFIRYYFIHIDTMDSYSRQTNIDFLL